MLTPPFRCWQDDRFVFVEIRLGATLVVKLSTAEFSIADTKFVFHCRPLYLRLSFLEPLAEGNGEKATFNVDEGLLLVQLPKLRPGEPFSRLDDPQYLLQTDVQRRQGQPAARRIEVVASSDDPDAAADGEDDDAAGDVELDCEFVQLLPAPSSVLPSIGAALGDGAGSGRSDAAVSYGFGGQFRGVFASLDADLVHEMLQLDADPETTPAAARRARRLQREQKDFDEEAMLCSLEDEDGEVQVILDAGRLSGCPPSYIAAFEAALRSSAIKWVGQRDDATPAAMGGARRAGASSGAALPGEEEDEGDDIAAGQRDVLLWQGNMMEFVPPAAEALLTTAAPDGPSGEDGTSASSPSDPSAAIPQPDAGGDDGGVAGRASAPPRRGQLAVPTTKPALTLSLDDAATLQTIGRPPAVAFATRAAKEALQDSADVLLIDLLCAVVYERLATTDVAHGGDSDGSSESLWSVCILSPSLAWLDVGSSVYDACVTFTRRVLTYPLHRHVDLAHRTFRDVGVLLLCGRPFVVQQLLWLRRLVGHSDGGRHVLNRLFVDPLLGHLMQPTVDATNRRLERLALVLHNIATMTEPVRVVLSRRQPPPPAGGGGGLDILLLVNSGPAEGSTATTATSTLMLPITVLSVGLVTVENAGAAEANNNHCPLFRLGTI